MPRQPIKPKNAANPALINVGDLMSSPVGQDSLLKNPREKTAKMQAERHAESKILKTATELEVRALTDITAFAELIVFHGGWASFGECHEELAVFLTKPQVDKQCQDSLLYEGDELAAFLRRLVLMPRGHLKSTIGTTLYSLWRIYRNPEIRILVGCNLQSLAYSFIREVRSYLEKPELQSVWNNRPHIEGNLIPAIQKKTNARNFNNDTEAEDRKVIWNNVALQVVREGQYKEPTLFATSSGTTVTGMHFDLIILDDLVDFKNVESEQKKTQTEEWIADVESVINPPRLTQVKGVNGFVLNDILGGEIIVNGTRYAVDDYYGQILEKKEDIGFQVHSRNIYRNGKDSSDGYLWHEKYTDRIVTALQARLSPRRFSSQYLNTVYEKDAHLFNTNAIQILPNDSVFSNGDKLLVRLPNGRTEVLIPVIAIDPAFSTSKTSDDCAILVGGKLSDGTVLVVDAALDRMIAAEVVTKVREFSDVYKTCRLFSEANGVGLLVPELFKPQATYVNGRAIIVYDHYEQRSKESKIQGVLELPINLGKVMFCQRVRDNEHIWKQVANYPGVRHDDFLDGLVTLFEKSTPSREVFQSSIQNISINGVPLNVNHLEQKARDQESKGYISRYGGIRRCA